MSVNELTPIWSKMKLIVKQISEYNLDMKQEWGQARKTPDKSDSHTDPMKCSANARRKISWMQLNYSEKLDSVV